MKRLKNRVSVATSTGRYVFQVHRERAVAMIANGEATYEQPGWIILTQAVRETPEMALGRILRIRAPRAESSTGDAGRGNTHAPRYRAMVFRAAFLAA